MKFWLKRRCKAMIETKIRVSEVNYEDAPDVLYPVLMEHIKQIPKWRSIR